MSRIKLRYTMTWTVDVDPSWYPEDNRTPAAIAAFERECDLDIVMDIATQQDDFVFTVVPEVKP